MRRIRVKSVTGYLALAALAGGCPGAASWTPTPVPTATDADTDTDADIDTDTGLPTSPVSYAETFDQATARYAAVFDPAVLHTVDVTFADVDWAAIQANGTLWTTATVVLDGETLPPVGVKLDGDQAQFGWDGKVAFKFDFDEFAEDGTYGGMERLDFDDQADDPTAGREVIANQVLLGAGLITPRASYAAVTFQGGTRGLFTIREHPDERFVKRWFTDATGDLWEGGNGADFTVSGLDAWSGSAIPPRSTRCASRSRPRARTSTRRPTRWCSSTSS